jgi:hypothetical protein
LYKILEKFTRRAKPIRLIGDPDNQGPDKWSTSALYLLLLGRDFVTPSQANLFFFLNFHSMILNPATYGREHVSVLLPYCSLLNCILPQSSFPLVNEPKRKLVQICVFFIQDLSWDFKTLGDGAERCSVRVHGNVVGWKTVLFACGKRIVNEI